MLRRSTPALLAAGALLLTGCSSNGDAAVAPSTGEQVRLVHDTGTVTLDDLPQRIVTTSDETTELVVALGLQPVGVASTRVDAAAADPFDGYYLGVERLGEPAFVGGAEVELEQLAALEPDLVVHGEEGETAGALAELAPTAVFDTTVYGSWQVALEALGGATGRQEEASAVVDEYDAAVEAAAQDLAPVAERFPRLGVIYPEYRGGTDNFLLGEQFALAGVVPDLGFLLAGSPRAEDAFPGVQSISAELYGTIDADALLALGTRPWTETESAAVLESLPVPVLTLALDAGQPSAGPITSPQLLERYRAALLSIS